jgi:hypothetical protein
MFVCVCARACSRPCLAHICVRTCVRACNGAVFARMRVYRSYLCADTRRLPSYACLACLRLHAQILACGCMLICFSLTSLTSLSLHACGSASWRSPACRSSARSCRCQLAQPVLASRSRRSAEHAMGHKAVAHWGIGPLCDARALGCGVAQNERPAGSANPRLASPRSIARHPHKAPCKRQEASALAVSRRPT